MSASRRRNSSAAPEIGRGARAHRRAASSAVGRAPAEWPTWFVALAVYAGWLALTWHASVLPWWLVLPAGAWLTAWHGSLQHEAIHGHPTASPRLNAALAWLPVGLWMPYSSYRATHRRHHDLSRLTDPGEDPESFYYSHEDWARMGPVRRAFLKFNQTLAGRLTIGPAIAAGRFWREESREIVNGDRERARLWAGHAAGVALVLAWCVLVCRLSVWEYVLFFAWPGLSLTLLRSFAEHEPATEERGRTVIVPGGPLTRLLYLNNNYHAVHHALPSLPWYRIPAAYRANRERFGRAGGTPHHRSYGEIVQRFLFRRRDYPVHPDHLESRPVRVPPGARGGLSMPPSR